MRGRRPYLDVDTLRMWQQHATAGVATLRNNANQLVFCTLLYLFMFFKLLSPIDIYPVVKAPSSASDVLDH